MPVVRRLLLLVLLLACAAMTSGCVALPFLFGGQASSASLGSESLPPHALDGGRFVRCRTEAAPPGSHDFSPAGVVDLHVVGDHGSSNAGEVVLRFDLRGPAAHPRLGIQTEVNGNGRVGESSQPSDHRGQVVGPTTIAVEGGSTVRYSCRLVRA
jgi:hypothetical protein